MFSVKLIDYHDCSLATVCLLSRDIGSSHSPMEIQSGVTHGYVSLHFVPICISAVHSPVKIIVVYKTRPV